MQNKIKILPDTYNFLRPKQTKKLARFGNKKDGGYIIDLTSVDKVNHLISFGMADEFSFEVDFLNHNNSNTLQIYDHTVNHKDYLSNILKTLRRFITFRAPLESLTTRIKYLYNYKRFLSLKNVSYFKEKITFPIKNKIDTDIDKAF